MSSTTISFLVKLDGALTASRELELLMDTHFPGSQIIPIEAAKSHEPPHSDNNSMEGTFEELL